jgi:hypothetical protein
LPRAPAHGQPVTPFLVTRPRLTPFRAPLRVSFAGGRFPAPPHSTWAGVWVDGVAVNAVVRTAEELMGEMRDEYQALQTEMAPRSREEAAFYVAWQQYAEAHIRETWIREWVGEHRDMLFLGTFLPSPHLFLLREVNLGLMRATHEQLPEMWAALLTGLSRAFGWVSCVAAWHMR